MDDELEINSGHRAPVGHRQIYSIETASRIAAMLDLEGCAWTGGTPVPFGWHFALLGAETARGALRADGFPGLGTPFPAVAGRRLVAAGRTVEARGRLLIGSEVARSSRTLSVIPKITPQGLVTIVKVAHEISVPSDDGLLLTEEQTFLLLDQPYAAPRLAAPQPGELPVIKTVTPDDTMLFQFSALSFNSHKIHLDRGYARLIEGYPDLVVNGGLVTLLMTELVRAEFGEDIRKLSVRNTAPLFANRTIQLALDTKNGRRTIHALDDHGRPAAQMEFATHEL